jgi:FMN reductase
MLDVVTIAGSPASPSRCAAALATTRDLLERRGLSTAAINLRDLPPEALVWARFNDPAIQRATALVADKGVLPIATAGSLAHCLVLEYALKPVLAALGASSFLPGVCLIDSDFVYEGNHLSRLETAAGGRLAAALEALEIDVQIRRERTPRLLEVAV